MFDQAEHYERFMGRWSRRLAPLLIAFAALREAASLLDAGSGTGVLSFALAADNPRCQVTGIDPSSAFVRFAAAHNPYPQRVRFLTGDAQSLAFAPASFDASLSLLVFNFIPNPEKALRELMRVTRPAGPVAAAVWDYADGMKMLRVFWDAVVETDPSARAADEARMPLSRPGELAALWTRAGLERVSQVPLDISMPFNSFADFWEPFLRAQGPAGLHVRSLGPARLQALRAIVLRRLALPSEDAPFTLPARAWAVRGVVPPGL